jgi:putative ABC transport system substrate-binding protein
MDRRTFLVAILASGCGPTESPQRSAAAVSKQSAANLEPKPGTQTASRIAFLTQVKHSDDFAGGTDLATLIRNLRDLGYVVGQNLTVDSRYAEEQIERLPTLARELVDAKPQVIVVPTAGVAEVVLQQTKTIPIVALAAGVLEQFPEVKSVAKPGGNLTGMQLFSPESMGKRLQLLQEVVPGLRRVGVLRGVPFAGPGFELYRNATDAAAAKLGLGMHYVQFDTAEDLKRLFVEMARDHDQALLVWGNPHVYTYRRELQDLTVRHRLPAVYDAAVNPDGLLIYAAKIDPVLREAATYVDRILKGAQPGDLPIGGPRTFELIINLKSAKAINIAIPDALLRRADEVIR